MPAALNDGEISRRISPLFIVLVCVGVAVIWMLASIQKTSSAPPEEVVGTLITASDCVRDDGEKISLDANVDVRELLRRKPADAELAALPPDSPLSRNLNRVYVKVISGLNMGEYCWLPAADIGPQR